MITEIESASPALCRLQLGSELRRLRMIAGLKSAQVVRRLLWSPSKLTRLEAGENVTVERSDVMALCEIYGAEKEIREVLLEYAAVTKTQRDWWHKPEYRPLISPDFRAFLGLEATAHSLYNYEAEFVPGLLQTEAYVRTIHQRALQRFSADEVERYVTVRMTRQDVLRRPPFPLKLTAVLNEAVLYRQVGDGALMRKQLTHIVETVETLPNVRVQVVPFRAGAHPGMNGSFFVLRFPENASTKSLVYLENLADALVLRRAGAIERYGEAFTDLQALAPGPQESLNLIKKAIKEH